MTESSESNSSIVKASRSVMFDFLPEGTPTPWTINVYSASDEPERWESHLKSSAQTYSQRNLDVVSKDREMAGSKFPTLFIEAELDGQIVGGMRLHHFNRDGRLPLLDELDGYINTDQLNARIQARRSEGILHAGGLWVHPDFKGTGLGNDIGRSHIAVIALANARWSVGTGHQYILGAWGSVGYEIDPDFHAFPYPDERYQTSVVWCDLTRQQNPMRAWIRSHQPSRPLTGPGSRARIHPLRVPLDC